MPRVENYEIEVQCKSFIESLERIGKNREARNYEAVQQVVEKLHEDLEVASRELRIAEHRWLVDDLAEQLAAARTALDDLLKERQ